MILSNLTLIFIIEILKNKNQIFYQKQSLFFKYNKLSKIKLFFCFIKKIRNLKFSLYLYIYKNIFVRFKVI